MIDAFNDADDQFSWFFSTQILDSRWLDAVVKNIHAVPDEEHREKWMSLLHKFYHAFERKWQGYPEEWRNQNGFTLHKWRDVYGALTRQPE